MGLRDAPWKPGVTDLWAQRVLDRMLDSGFQTKRTHILT